MKKKTVYKKMNGVENRERLAYCTKSLFPHFNIARYPSRTGFFLALDHYRYKGKQYIQLTYKGQLYEIDSRIARKHLFQMSKVIPSLPDMVPFELWQRSEIPEHKIAVEWEIDPVRNVARAIEYKPEPEQMKFL